MLRRELINLFVGQFQFSSAKYGAVTISYLKTGIKILPSLMVR